jgi:menaquinone-9 beta-reductase
LDLTHVETNVDTEAISSCDVLIVGAGPAGSAAAYYMAKAGMKVVVLEKERFPRDKVCGDFVSPGSIKELQKIGIADLAEFKAANKVTQATIYLDGKELVAGVFPVVSDLPRYSRVVPRKILDSLLVAVAKEAGAKVVEGFRVIDYKIEKDSVVVTATQGKRSRVFHARLLVGADGNNSLIARTLNGAGWSKVETALVARAYFEGVRGSPLEANVYYGNYSFPGYSWLFPTAKGEANVGVGLVGGASPEAENPKDLLLNLVQNDAGMQKCLEHARLKGDVEVCALNLHDKQAKIVGDRVLLVGEAAGLVNPYNGEGIQFGLKSGCWAAETAAASLANNDFSASALSSYSKRVSDELGYGFGVSELMLGLLRNRNLNNAWLRWIELMGEKSKTDPEYARLTSGVLSGMIFPNEEAAAKTLMGTLEEAAVSVGLTTLNELVQNPSTLPQSTITIIKTGFAAAEYAAQDPLNALRWGMDAALKVSEIAATISKQVLKDAENKNES